LQAKKENMQGVAKRKKKIFSEKIWLFVYCVAFSWRDLQEKLFVR
jgi:hypothetical protein